MDFSRETNSTSTVMSTESKTESIFPEKLEKLQLSIPSRNSVGIPAILSTIGHVSKYMTWRNGIKLSLAINQKKGFDCPGCAWPDPDDDRSKLGEYCENGMKAIAEEASKKIIGHEFFAKNSIDKLKQLTDFELGKLGRLAEPLILKSGDSNYQPISWDHAFDSIGDALNALNSPDEALFYTSGRTSNEAAYLYQLFVRAFGTNNLPDCSNMCHESSGVALSETLGIGKGSVTLEDIHQSDLIIVMGQNPGTNHPRMLTALEKCKENGGKIITVNPLKEPGLIKYTNPQSIKKVLTGGIDLTDLYLQIQLNGDVAFLKALMIELTKREENNPGSIFDHDFIKEHTLGFDSLISELKDTNLQSCLEDCGLSLEQIRRAADLVSGTSKIIVCWAMGLTQHENGVDNIKEIVNLLLLKGAIGKPGAGTCPVRGHSNVQGDRTMGIWEAPPKAFLDNLDNHHKITSPRKHGLAVVPAIHAMHEEKAKVFIAMGGNFLAASPDTNYTAEALTKCKLTVHVSTKLNRSHLIHGETALILPCLGRTDIDIQDSGEQFVSCENSMGVVQASKGILSPPSKHLKSEIAIVSELAKATLKDSKIKWGAFTKDYDQIRDAIEEVIPGFENYNTRIRIDGGFYLPNGVKERNFNTASGKAHFTVNPIPKNQKSDDEFFMMTIRSHDQFNTTIYGMNDRYRGIKNERRVVFMNHKDIEKTGLKSQSKVNLINNSDGKHREVNNFIVVPYEIPEGNIATYFPETNPLVPITSFAKGSLTPASKMVKVRIENSLI